MPVTTTTKKKKGGKKEKRNKKFLNEIEGVNKVADGSSKTVRTNMRSREKIFFLPNSIYNYKWRDVKCLRCCFNFVDRPIYSHKHTTSRQ